MAKISPEQRLRKIEFAGIVLAKSKRWQSALAEASCVSQTMISAIMSGDRVLSPAIEERIGKGLIEKAGEMRKHAAAVEAAGRKIIGNL
jgi:hypothetical protein